MQPRQRRARAPAARQTVPRRPAKKRVVRRIPPPMPEKPEGAISSVGKALGAAAGTYLGGPAGTAIGSFLGGKLGHLVEKITGFGDYTVESNSIMDGGLSPPQIVNSIEKGGFIIRHREYVQDIVATSDFTALQFPLNPGVRKSFPWLSQIAGNFEQYRWRGLLFEFKSTSSDAVLSSATSSALGVVAIATDYDAADSAYASKRVMLNSMFACSSKPSVSFIHPIECKSSLTPMRLQYIRTGAIPSNTDPRMYDIGNTYVATEGMQSAGGVVGELWVTYEVEFYKQQVAHDNLTDHFKLTSPASATWLAIGSTNHPNDPAATLGGSINDAGDTYTFPANISDGLFLLTYNCYGTSAASIGQINLSYSGCAAVDLWNAATAVVQAPAAGVSSAYIMAGVVVRISAPSAVIQFNAATLPGGTTTGDFFITQIDDALTDY